jgi:Flp pilus assembly protein TadB
MINETLIFLVISFNSYLLYKIIKSRIKLEARIGSFVDSRLASENIQIEKQSFNLLNRLNKSKNHELSDLICSSEFADLFAITLVSGQSPRAGLETVTEFVAPHYQVELNIALEENLYGKPLIISLKEMSEKKDMKILKPLSQQIDTALERGTPLAEVVRNFSQDQRNRFRNLLTKQAAAKEISMLLPVVFVVLPSVLAVALYPALTVLQKLG